MYTVAATWLRWMELPTTAGKAIRSWFSVFALVVAALTGGACAGPSAEPMQRHFDSTQRQMDTVLKQARTESTALRAELAEARIAAAKQEAELEELRHQLAELRQAVEARQVEQAQLRAERDKLNEAKGELQTQLVEVPLLRQNLADAKMAEAKAQAQVKQLQSALVTAGVDLKQRKKGGVMAAAKASGPAKKRTKPVTVATATGDGASNSPDGAQPAAQPSVFTATAAAVDDGGTRRVTVVKDETLWRIARRYNITVDQLREFNGLKGSMILEGQTLIIPSR